MSEIDEEQQAELEAVVSESRGSFDLGARLKKRTMLTDSVTVFTDEIVGRQQLEADRKLQNVADGAANLKRVAELLEKMDQPEVAALVEERAEQHIVDKDEYARLEAESEALKEVLRKSALTIDMQGIPPIIAKDTRRVAKQKLGIKGNIPIERAEDFAELAAALLLQKMATRITDAETGSVNTSVSLEDAQALIDYLPSSEWLKVDNVMAKLSVYANIGEEVTAQGDFSPAT